LKTNLPCYLNSEMSRFLRTSIKIIFAVLSLAVILIAGACIVVSVSPKPFAWYMRQRFGTGVGVNTVTPPSYQELSEKVRVEKDIEYPSQFRGNRLDVFSAKGATGPLPTILWTHGGGFVGGDKAGIARWATMIAAKGYTVVSINYELAWENHYPGPLIQFGEAYEFLKHEPQRFPFADFHRLIIGGDSAGAQIASQCVALQITQNLRARCSLVQSFRNEAPQFVATRTTSLDDPSWFNPQADVWTSDAHPWDHMNPARGRGSVSSDTRPVFVHARQTGVVFTSRLVNTRPVHLAAAAW